MPKNKNKAKQAPKAAVEVVESPAEDTKAVVEGVTLSPAMEDAVAEQEGKALAERDLNEVVRASDSKDEDAIIAVYKDKEGCYSSHNIATRRAMRRFITAIREGTIPDVCASIEEIGVNVVFPGAYLPIHIACDTGRIEIVDCLIQHGAYLDMDCSEFDRPIEVAIREGHIELVRMLINAGAKLNYGEDDVCYALDVAETNLYPDIEELIAANGGVFAPEENWQRLLDDCRETADNEQDNNKAQGAGDNNNE